MWRSWRTLCLCILLVSAVVISILCGLWFGYYKRPLPISASGETFIIFPKEGVRDIVHDLYRAGIIRHPELLEFIIVTHDKAHRLRVGEYLVKPGTTPQTLIQQFIAGKVVQHRFTLVPGWTWHELKAALTQAKLYQHHLKTLTTQQLVALLKIKSKAPHPLEGQFLPNTYFYTYFSSDTKLLKRMHRAWYNYVLAEWALRAADLPYTRPLQAVTMASMIEKEVYLPKERSLVAGVIINRLRKNMLLQIDATVIYAMGPDFSGPLTLKNLEMSSPYNTYEHKGLPPGPIAMPGRAAIHAALHPQKTDYLYYVVKGDGSHVFSTTYKAHRLAIAKYLRGSDHRD